MQTFTFNYEDSMLTLSVSSNFMTFLNNKKINNVKFQFNNRFHRPEVVRWNGLVYVRFPENFHPDAPQSAICANEQTVQQVRDALHLADAQFLATTQLPAIPEGDRMDI